MQSTHHTNPHVRITHLDHDCIYKQEQMAKIQNEIIMIITDKHRNPKTQPAYGSIIWEQRRTYSGNTVKVTLIRLKP